MFGQGLTPSHVLQHLWGSVWDVSCFPASILLLPKPFPKTPQLPLAFHHPP